MKLRMSKHALERYWERVNKGSEEHHAMNWVNQAMKTATFVDYGDGRVKRYRFKEYLIVLQGELVVTISYHNNIEARPFRDELKDTIAKKLKRMATPYRRLHRELCIEMYEAEIRKLRVFNPKTQEIIDGKISEIKGNISAAERSLKDIEDLANKYGIDI